MVMTVQCPECGTEFPVDPMKVPETGVRAQCSVCPGVFPVFRPEGWGDEPAGVPESEGAMADWGDDSVALEPEPYSAEPEVEGPLESSTLHHHEVQVEEEEVLEAEFQTEEEYRESIELDGVIEYGGAMAPEDEAVLEEVLDQGDQVTDVEWVEEAQEPYGSVVEAEGEAVAEGGEVEEEPFEAEPLEYEEVPPSPESGLEEPAAPSPGPIQFGRRDPKEKARRLARVLVSDMIVYHRDRHERALAEGTLKQEFEEEIQKSWDEYVEQVGGELAASTPYFTEALNDILARGQEIF